MRADWGGAHPQVGWRLHCGGAAAFSLREPKRRQGIRGVYRLSLEESVSVCCRLQTTADRLHTMAGELRRRRGVGMGKR